MSMVYSRDHTVAEGLDHIVSSCVKSLYGVQFFIIFCRLQIFSKFTFSKVSFRNTIRVTNGLDPDQAQRSVMLDLGPNFFVFQRLSTDDKICSWQAKN